MESIQKTIIALLFVFFLACIGVVSEAADPGGSFIVPYNKNIEVVIEPAPSANLQVLYFLDKTDNEVYNFRLAGDATSFVIDRKYLHSGKEYSLYLVAFSESNTPSDPSNIVPFIIESAEIPEERFPPEKLTQTGSQILEVK